MLNNPFKKGTVQYLDFQLMSDLKWHCTKCELKSVQAKIWQMWRQEKGITLKMHNGKYYSRIFCSTCNRKTYHRGLETLEINTENTKARSGLSNEVRKKIKELYNCVDEFTLRKEAKGKLEIDHRFPQIRWTNDEQDNNNLSDDELKNKFMLLTRENNLLKSRSCENCHRTGKRSKGYGISFWYEGDENWNDEIKCEGCFWYSPSKWRQAIQDILNKEDE